MTTAGLVAAGPAVAQAAAPVILGGGLLLVVVGIVVYSSIELVTAYEKKALAVNGEYRRMLEPGVHVVPPFVATTASIDMRTQRATATVDATTADDATVTVTAAVDAAVTDAERAYRETDDYRRDVLAAAEASLQRAVEDVDSDVLAGEPGEVAERTELAMQRRTAGWGLDIEAVAVTGVEGAAGGG